MSDETWKLWRFRLAGVLREPPAAAVDALAEDVQLHPDEVRALLKEITADAERARLARLRLWPCDGQFDPATQKWNRCGRPARWRVDDAWCACDVHRPVGGTQRALPWVEELEER